MHSYIHAHVHTYIHTYVCSAHIYIYIYICMATSASSVEARAPLGAGVPGTQFTCCNTKVQILTPEELRARRQRIVGGMGRGQRRKRQRRAIRCEAEHEQAGRCCARRDTAPLDRRVSAYHQPEKCLSAALAIAPESIARRRHCRDCRGGREATRGGRVLDATATPLAAQWPTLSLQGRKRQREFGGEGQESVGVPTTRGQRGCGEGGTGGVWAGAGVWR